MISKISNNKGIAKDSTRGALTTLWKEVTPKVNANWFVPFISLILITQVVSSFLALLIRNDAQYLSSLFSITVVLGFLTLFANGLRSSISFLVRYLDISEIQEIQMAWQKFLDHLKRKLRSFWLFWKRIPLRFHYGIIMAWIGGKTYFLTSSYGRRTT